MKNFFLILAVICTAVFSNVTAQQTVKVTDSGIGYLEYLPQGYSSNKNKYPLVISLHGIKEKGTSSRDPKLVKAGVMRVASVGLPKYAKNGKKYPFILISPQLKNNYGVWPSDYVIEVLNYVKKHLRVDDRKIYLTGLSLGGFGVWRTAGDYPHLFAAIAPVCSGGSALSKADKIAAENVPIWGFHGSKDRVVSHQVTIKMVNAVNTAPKRPNPLAKATIFPGMNHSIWDRAYNETNVLNWMLSFTNGKTGGDHGQDGDDDDSDDNDEDEDEDDEEKNTSPVVNAGSNKTLTLPTNSLYLQGQASDKDGKITSYKWTKISGGQSGLSSATSPRARAYDLEEGNYTFRLTVKDNKGATRSDDISVSVVKESDSSDKNKLPYVNAGPDEVISPSTNTISLQGRATDKDGSIVSYQWTQTYGGRVNLSGTNSSKVRLSNLANGAYIFRLTVKDNKGGVSSDLIKVTVRKQDNDNSLPVVTGGPDRVLRLPDNTIEIQGKATDKDGSIVSYQWTKTYGGRVNVSGGNGSRVRLSNLQRGAYIFRLTAKDNKGGVQHDYIKVTVKS